MEQHGSKKLWNKDFFLLVIVGQAVSLFGNTIIRFALPLYILEITGSAALFGMISALSFLPMIIMSPLGGIIADRVNKKWVVVVLDFATGVLMLIYIGVSNFMPIVPVTVVMLMALFAIQGMLTPTVQASVPQLVASDKLLSANAIVNLVTSLAGMIGPIIGGILFANFGLSPILYVGSICFAFSAVIEMFINIPHVKQKSSGGMFRIIKDDMYSSLRFITKDKPFLAKSVMIIFCFNVMLSSMLLIGLPVLITQNLGMDSSMLGVTQSTLMAGGLVGGILAGVFGGKLHIQKIHWLLLICALSIVPMGLAFFLGASDFVTYIIITATIPITMCAATLFSILIMSFVQSQAPVEIIGKIMSFIMALSLSAQPIGQLLYGMLFEYFFYSPWIVIAISTLLSSIIAIYSRKQFREIEI